MNLSTIVIALAAITCFGYVLGRQRAVPAFGTRNAARFHSLPGYYGGYVALWCAVPAIALLLVWVVFEPIYIESTVIGSLPESVRALPAERIGLVYNDIRNLVEGNIVSGEPDAAMLEAAQRYSDARSASRWLLTTILAAIASAATVWALTRVRPHMRARVKVEVVIEYLLIAASSIAVLTTIGIFLSVLFESLRFFSEVSPLDFLFGLEWSPQTAIREDQVGSSGAFGAVPLFVGTMLISAIAMIVAVPVGLMSAIYLSEYASRRVRAYAKPMLEVLAGIPTVVYGYFAALTVGPLLRDFGTSLPFDVGVSSESA
ncbi:MAG TPA: phosphate ABC transporter permease family protein, partial [Gammaproteobacteria bacterium]|nr:phosphate ABC transporter permease family protein [Gammaproteobacteria bacterium]